MGAFDIVMPPGVGFAWVDEESVPTLDHREAATLSDRAVARRRLEFAMGRGAAHRALEQLGVPFAPLLPGPLGGPRWPTGFVGSITHGYGYGLAAVAPTSVASAIGVDLESLDRHFPGLVNQIAFDAERSRLSTLPASESARRAIELFAVKEAFYKAFAPQVGSYFGFEAARTRQRDGHHYDVWFVDQLVDTLPAERVSSVAFRWFDDLVFAWLIVPADR